MSRTAADTATRAAGSGRDRSSSVGWLWPAAILAAVGAWLQETTAAWLMTELTRDARLVTGVQAVITFGVCLAVLISAALVDLVDMRRLVRGTSVVLAFIAVMLATLVLTGVVGPVLLLLVAAAMGLGHGVLAAGWPALAAGGAGSGLTGSVTAGAAHAGHQWIGRASGGSLGGLLIAGVGIAAALCADAGAFLAAAASVRRMPARRAAETVTAARVTGALRAGAHTAVLTPTVRNAALRVGALAFGTSAIWSLLVVVARGPLDLGPAGFGLLQAAAGLGGICGVVLVLRLLRRRPTGIAVTALTLACALAMIVPAVWSSVPAVAIAMVAIGAAWTGVIVLLCMAVQTAVPEAMRARMLGACLAALYLTAALGSAVWGHVAALLGVSSTLGIAAATVAAATAATAWLDVGRLPRRQPSGRSAAVSRRAP